MSKPSTSTGAEACGNGCHGCPSGRKVVVERRSASMGLHPALIGQVNASVVAALSIKDRPSDLGVKTMQENFVD